MFLLVYHSEFKGEERGEKVEIRLNGERYELPPGVLTAEDLLHHLGIDKRIVVMEQNRNVLEREQWKETRINAGDELEIVHFVGGG